jgi:hypothetical protein
VLLEDITRHEEDDEEPAPATPAPPLPALPALAPAAPAAMGEQEMAPTDEEEPTEVLGWTCTYIYKHAPHIAYHHKLLNDML